MQIDFYWDIGSTNTYFAYHLIQPIAERYGAAIRFIPFNLGHVFRTHRYVLAEEPRAKLANRRRDLERWAERYGLPFRMPDQFPIKTSRALRAALAAREMGHERAFLDALFSAYWERNDASIVEYPGLTALANELGLDGDALVALADSVEMRAALAEATDGGLARGVFGAPSFYIGDELFWGKDRMEFIEAALAEASRRAT